MGNYSNKNQIANELREMLDQERLSRQESITRMEQIEKILGVVLSWPDPKPQPRSQTGILLIDNGQEVLLNGIHEFCEDNYDVVLDMITGTLKTRAYPSSPADLLVCQCRNLGQTRLAILCEMLENPDKVFKPEQNPQLQNTENDKFIHTMKLFRDVIQNGNVAGPYLYTLEKFEKKGKGPQYRLAKGRYAVLKSLS